MNTSFSYSLKISLLLALFTLASCASLYTIKDSIPGLDRIIHAFSTAEVGPVQDHKGNIIEVSDTGSEAGIAFKREDASDLNNELNSEINTNTNSTNQASAVIPQPSFENSPNVPSTQLNRTLDGSSSIASEINDTIQTASTLPKPNTHTTQHAYSGSLSGTVKLLAKQGLISSKGLIVRLNRTDGKAMRPSSSQVHHDMDMLDKVYTPANIVVRKGDRVNFVNKDKIQHNVFSSSQNNAFDLGTFGGGLQRTVTLNEEGVVKVYCNIHPGMAAYVAVDDTGLSHVISNAEGAFEFSNLQVGEYSLTVWSIRGQHTEQVSVLATNNQTVNITFDTSSYQPVIHSDKYGKAYKKRNARREFY